jgi:hypothetical protein
MSPLTGARARGGIDAGRDPDTDPEAPPDLTARTTRDGELAATATVAPLSFRSRCSMLPTPSMSPPAEMPPAAPLPHGICRDGDTRGLFATAAALPHFPPAPSTAPAPTSASDTDSVRFNERAGLLTRAAAAVRGRGSLCSAALLAARRSCCFDAVAMESTASTFALTPSPPPSMPPSIASTRRGVACVSGASSKPVFPPSGTARQRCQRNAWHSIVVKRKHTRARGIGAAQRRARGRSSMEGRGGTHV